MTRRDLKYLPYQERRKIQTEISVYAIMNDRPLEPWMKRLAEYAASQPLRRGRIVAKDLRPIADKLAGVQVPSHAIKRLILRDDWLAIRDGIAADEVQRARKQLEQRAGEYLDTHYEAMQAARKNIKEDPRTAAIITEPIVNRVWPVKDDKGTAPTTVVIHLGPQQQAEQVLHYEVLPVEVVETPATES